MDFEATVLGCRSSYSWELGWIFGYGLHLLLYLMIKIDRILVGVNLWGWTKERGGICVYPPSYQTRVYLLKILYDLYWLPLRRAVKIEGQNSETIALIVNDSSGWLAKKLSLVLNILKHLMPDTMQHHKSGEKLGNFKSIHCDIWNRYTENVNLSL